MPLVKGQAARSRKGFSENVKREMHSGKPQKQSVAIAYSEADKAMKKSRNRKENHRDKSRALERKDERRARYERRSRKK